VNNIIHNEPFYITNQGVVDDLWSQSGFGLTWRSVSFPRSQMARVSRKHILGALVVCPSFLISHSTSPLAGFRDRYWFSTLQHPQIRGPMTMAD
jgi:hypothetical protein